MLNFISRLIKQYLTFEKNENALPFVNGYYQTEHLDGERQNGHLNFKRVPVEYLIIVIS